MPPELLGLITKGNYIFVGLAGIGGFLHISTANSLRKLRELEDQLNAMSTEGE